MSVNERPPYELREKRVLIDISPPITERLQVWPGDTRPRRELLLSMDRGDPTTLSSLLSTVHLGAHADAPSHYGRGARAIDQQALELYVGPCQVIRVDTPKATAIKALPVAVNQPRVLIATDTYPDSERFNQDFAALAPSLVEELHRQGVRLIGIDTPSVDLFDAADLPSHLTCLRCDIAILEGLHLEGVSPGVYELIALPLRLVGFEASPVRAVLRTLE